MSSIILKRSMSINDDTVKRTKTEKTDPQNTSARNFYDAIVTDIKIGSVTTIVEFKIKDSDLSMISLITNRAAENLDLDIDDEIVAFFKASSVIVAKVDKEYDITYSVDNVFRSKLTEISNYGEDTNELSCELKLTSIIDTNIKFVSIISYKSVEIIDNNQEFDVIINSTNIILSKKSKRTN